MSNYTTIETLLNKWIKYNTTYNIESTEQLMNTAIELYQTIKGSKTNGIPNSNQFLTDLEAAIKATEGAAYIMFGIDSNKSGEPWNLFSHWELYSKAWQEYELIAAEVNKSMGFERRS